MTTDWRVLMPSMKTALPKVDTYQDVGNANLKILQLLLIEQTITNL